MTQRDITDLTLTEVSTCPVGVNEFSDIYFVKSKQPRSQPTETIPMNELEIFQNFTGAEKSAFDGLTEAEQKDFLTKSDEDRASALKVLTEKADADAKAESEKAIKEAVDKAVAEAKAEADKAAEAAKGKPSDPDAEVVFTTIDGDAITKGMGALTLRLAKESDERRIADTVKSHLDEIAIDAEAKTALAKSVLASPDAETLLTALKGINEAAGSDTGRDSTGESSKAGEPKEKGALSADKAFEEVQAKAKEMVEKHPSMSGHEAFKAVVDSDTKRYAALVQ